MRRPSFASLHDGSRLSYRNRDEASRTTHVMKVAFDGSFPRPVLGKPEELFAVETVNGWIGLDGDDRLVEVGPVEKPEGDERADNAGIVLLEHGLSRFRD